MNDFIHRTSCRHRNPQESEVPSLALLIGRFGISRYRRPTLFSEKNPCVRALCSSSPCCLRVNWINKYIWLYIVAIVIIILFLPLLNIFFTRTGSFCSAFYTTVPWGLRIDISGMNTAKVWGLFICWPHFSWEVLGWKMCLGPGHLDSLWRPGSEKEKQEKELLAIPWKEFVN